MAEKESDREGRITRSMDLPERVWAALRLDADMCRRSVPKQLEAILTVYYGLDDVELGDVAGVRDTVSPYAARPGTLAFDRKLKFLTGGGEPEEDTKKPPRKR